MSKRVIQGRRDFLRLSAIATGASVAATCLPPGTATPTDAELGNSGLRVGRLEGGVIVTDSAQIPRSFNEAPELAEAVRTGSLPPVAERIGQDPLVLRPLHEVGKYGGTFRRAFNSASDQQNSNRFAAGPDRFLFWDFEWKRVTPWLARAYEESSDGRTLELQLRRGMRWSDGQPFTADDVMFWYEDIYLNTTLNPTKNSILQINGKDVVIRKIDTYTVRYESPEPNFLLKELMASATNLGGQFVALGQLLLGGFAPAHYVKKIHPTYDAAGAEAARVAGNFANVRAMLQNRLQYTVNADIPVLAPWKTRKGNEITTQNWIMERNPYYVGVDTAGNQLPYIGSLQHTLGANLEVINLRAVAGEYDFQDRHLDMAKIPLLKENEDRAGYRIFLDPGESGIGIRVNLDYVADQEIGGLYKQTNFRKALSLGIDRGQINEAFFLGAATPGSYAPPITNKYSPGQASVDAFAKLDIAQANQLLDGLGYTQKDGEGFRVRKDNGQRLRLEFKPVTGTFADFPGMAEMVRQQWRSNLALDSVVTPIATTVAASQAIANQIQLSIHQIGAEDLYITPDAAFPFITNNYTGMSGIAYAQWFQSNGAQGKEPFPELKELMSLWRQGYAATAEERTRIGKEWWTKATDVVLQIGLVNADLAVYGFHYAKNNVANVPARMRNATPITNPAIALPQTFFYR